MKKSLMILIALCVLATAGCRTTKDTSELFQIPSLSSGIISITDINDNIVNTPIIEYTGGKITYKLVTNISQTKESGPDSFNRVFYILLDGYLQPFYFENSNEPVLYAVIDSEADMNFSYTFSFEPLYVPYGKNAVLSFIISNSPDYFQRKSTEQVLCSSMEQNYCLTAYSTEYIVNYEKKENIAEFITDFPAGSNQTAGVILAEKINSAEQFKINTMFDTDEQLYATVICTEDTDARLYTVVDGELADIFADEYYVDVSMKAGNTYEIPLDMEYLTKDVKHQVYFVMIDKNEIEILKNCSTGQAMMSHSITSMTYGYLAVVR